MEKFKRSIKMSKHKGKTVNPRLRGFSAIGQAIISGDDPTKCNNLPLLPLEGLRSSDNGILAFTFGSSSKKQKEQITSELLPVVEKLEIKKTGLLFAGSELFPKNIIINIQRDADIGSVPVNACFPDSGVKMDIDKEEIDTMSEKMKKQLIKVAEELVKSVKRLKKEVSEAKTILKTNK